MENKNGYENGYKIFCIFVLDIDLKDAGAGSGAGG